MPQPYTGSLTGIQARQNATITEMLGTDVRSSSSVYTPLRELANLLQYLMKTAGLIDQAQDWSALQTFAAGLVVPGGQNDDIAIDLSRAGIQNIRKSGGDFLIGTNTADAVRVYSDNTVRIDVRADGTVHFNGSPVTGVGSMTVDGELNLSRTTGAGHNLAIGNDAYIDDVNASNAVAIVGRQEQAYGVLQLGSVGSERILGWNGFLEIISGGVVRLATVADSGVAFRVASRRITEVGAPQADGDAANKNYVDTGDAALDVRLDAIESKNLHPRVGTLELSAITETDRTSAISWATGWANQSGGTRLIKHGRLVTLVLMAVRSGGTGAILTLPEDCRPPAGIVNYQFAGARFSGGTVPFTINPAGALIAPSATPNETHWLSATWSVL